MQGWTGPEFPNNTKVDGKIPDYNDFSEDCSALPGGGCLFELESDPTEHDEKGAANPDKLKAMLGKIADAQAKAAQHKVADEALQLAIDQVAQGDLVEARHALELAKKAYKVRLARRLALRRVRLRRSCMHSALARTHTCARSGARAHMHTHTRTHTHTHTHAHTHTHTHTHTHQKLVLLQARRHDRPRSFR